MEFDEDASIDTSQIDDRRGARAGRVPGGVAGAGAGGLGIVGIIVVVLVQLLGGGGGGLGSLSGLENLQVGTATDGAPPSDLAETCRTGADANTKDDCRIAATVNSVQAYWSQNLQSTLGVRYQPTQTRFFSGPIDTGCGPASSEVGPFYCPGDRFVYIDLGFFKELQDKFGANGGPFAQAYIMAHEYAHHIQNLTGDNARVGNDRSGPTSGLVRLELQADCYAGVWARHATTTPDPNSGRPLITNLTDADIADALDAAAAVGDDRIQEQYQGRVTPESWTHGSSEQRQRWFMTGYTTGDPRRCDTFSVRTL